MKPLFSSPSEIGFASLVLLGCATTHVAAKPASYEAELVTCNQKANTLKESVDCENQVRSKYGRPPREEVK